MEGCFFKVLFFSQSPLRSLYERNTQEQDTTTKSFECERMIPGNNCDNADEKEIEDSKEWYIPEKRQRSDADTLRPVQCNNWGHFQQQFF